MPLRQKVFFLAVAVILVLVIAELVRRRRLRVEYSWLWLGAGATIVVVILRYDLLVALTALIGAVLPTSTLFFLALLFLALLCLDYAVRLTTLTRQVKELAQELALLRAERSGIPAVPTDATEGGEPAVVVTLGDPASRPPARAEEPPG